MAPGSAEGVVLTAQDPTEVSTLAALGQAAGMPMLTAPDRKVVPAEVDRLLDQDSTDDGLLINLRPNYHVRVGAAVTVVTCGVNCGAARAVSESYLLQLAHPSVTGTRTYKFALCCSAFWLAARCTIFYTRSRHPEGRDPRAAVLPGPPVHFSPLPRNQA